MSFPHSSLDGVRSSQIKSLSKGLSTATKDEHHESTVISPHHQQATPRTPAETGALLFEETYDDATHGGGVTLHPLLQALRKQLTDGEWQHISSFATPYDSCKSLHREHLLGTHSDQLLALATLDVESCASHATAKRWKARVLAAGRLADGECEHPQGSTSTNEGIDHWTNKLREELRDGGVGMSRSWDTTTLPAEYGGRTVESPKPEGTSTNEVPKSEGTETSREGWLPGKGRASPARQQDWNLIGRGHEREKDNMSISLTDMHNRLKGVPMFNYEFDTTLDDVTAFNNLKDKLGERLAAYECEAFLDATPDPDGDVVATDVDVPKEVFHEANLALKLMLKNSFRKVEGGVQSLAITDTELSEGVVANEAWLNRLSGINIYRRIRARLLPASTEVIRMADVKRRLEALSMDANGGHSAFVRKYLALQSDLRKFGNLTEEYRILTEPKSLERALIEQIRKTEMSDTPKFYERVRDQMLGDCDIRGNTNLTMQQIMDLLTQAVAANQYRKTLANDSTHAVHQVGQGDDSGAEDTAIHRIQWKESNHKEKYGDLRLSQEDYAKYKAEIFEVTDKAQQQVFEITRKYFSAARTGTSTQASSRSNKKKSGSQNKGN
jgi:hypothetical protein